ncbi:thioesterase family protein [Vulgatibacter sp.]|uniref:thioesterase family protein n=1 Tax=Vulgatibacter sp. TaxID=1971226 RepID=UPI0035639091
MLASYLTRLGKTAIGSLRRSRIDALGEARLPLRTWPLDVDTYLHVNNGRYLTLMDFGRFDHAIRSGLLRAMLANRWRPILGAATVEYRRELLPLQRFELATRLVAWDEKWFYMEQRFERSGTLHAQAMVRGVLKQGRRTVPPAELLRAVGHDGRSPEKSPALQRWIEAQAAS